MGPGQQGSYTVAYPLSSGIGAWAGMIASAGISCAGERGRISSWCGFRVRAPGKSYTVVVGGKTGHNFGNACGIDVRPEVGATDEAGNVTGHALSSTAAIADSGKFYNNKHAANGSSEAMHVVIEETRCFTVTAKFNNTYNPNFVFEITGPSS